ncbi:ribosome maturation protein [Amylostereum chailletii]|nr:ribosome maturation protein [Amylostereum chailletii]
MSPALTKVVYQPSSKEGLTFIVIVNAPEYKRYKDGDTTIPLVDVVDSFKILSSGQGAQGILGTASKQELENTFGTSRDDEVVKQILEKGRAETTDGIQGSKWGSKNDTMGSAIIDTKGGNRTSGI